MSLNPNGKRNIYARDLSISALSKIQECRSDQLYHITPIVALFNMTPKQLKKHLGKSSWKKITKNTHSKNRYLFFIIIDSYKMCSKAEKKLRLIELQDFSNSTLHVIFNNDGLSKISPETCNMIEAWSKDCNKVELDRRFKIYKDTFDMAKQMNYPFTKGGKWADVNRLHDTLVALYDGARLNIPKDAVFSLPAYCEKKLKSEIEEQDFNFKFLKTVADFSKEKSDMKHCILSYCKKSYNKRYVACHIEKDGVHSTLGIRYNNQTKTFQKDQHYGKRNSLVTKDIESIGHKIIRLLNRKNAK